MEADTAADLRATLMFDFDFDDAVDLIDSNHSQTQYPTQQHKTSVNFSHVEMGSSSGNNIPPVFVSGQNLTATAPAHTSSEDLDSSLQTPQNLAQQAPSSVNQDPFVGITQAYNPPTVVQESSEFHLPDEENNQPQGGSANSTSNANLSGHGHFSQESTNQQLVGSAPNNLSPIITSSLKTPLSGTAAQSSFPTAEHVELGSSSGSNQSFVYNSKSNQQSWNLMGSTYNLGFGGTDPSLRNGINVQQNQSTFLQSPSGNSQQYPPTTNQVEMVPQFGGVPSNNPEQEISSNNSNQLSTRSENGIQNDLLRPQGIDSLNLPNTLCADQLAQNVGNSNFLNHKPAVLPYTTSIPQTSTGLGINQQPPTPWFSNQNALYTPLGTPSRPQVNQFLASNVFDSQCANSMQPGSSVPLRPQHLANNQQQLTPVLPAKNVLNPQSQYSMIPDQSMFPRLQSFPSQSGQLLPMAPNNVQEQGGCANSMLPVPSMPFNMSMRPPQFPLHQQLNQAAGTPDLSSLQPAKSMQTKNSLLLRNQQPSSDHAPLTLPQMMPNMMDPQRDNSFHLGQSMPPRGMQTFDLQALRNQSTKPSVTYPIPGSSQPPILNSSTNQRDLFGGHNPLGATAPTFPQLQLSLTRSDQQIFLGRRNRSTSPFELGEASSSSSPSKRPRMSNFPYKDFILKENEMTSQSRENEGDRPQFSNPFTSIARPGKNALYDPLFEGIGLPIDPHLRLFSSH